MPRKFSRNLSPAKIKENKVVSTEFDLELNFLLLPYGQNCFFKLMKTQAAQAHARERIRELKQQRF